MALNHIKFVEDYTSRMKYIAKRDAEEKARIEAKLLAKKKAKENEPMKDAVVPDGEKTTSEATAETPQTVDDVRMVMFF